MTSAVRLARRLLVSRLLTALAVWGALGWTMAPSLVAGDAAVLTAPRTLYAGGRSSLTLTTIDAATRASGAARHGCFSSARRAIRESSSCVSCPRIWS